MTSFTGVAEQWVRSSEGWDAGVWLGQMDCYVGTNIYSAKEMRTVGLQCSGIYGALVSFQCVGRLTTAVLPLVARLVLSSGAGTSLLRQQLTGWRTISIFVAWRSVHLVLPSLTLACFCFVATFAFLTSRRLLIFLNHQ